MDKKIATTIVVFFLNTTISLSQTPDNSYGCWSNLDGIINLLSDSLNLIDNPSKLPKFLSDSLLDWKFRNHLKICVVSRNEKISIRKTVLTRVYREDVLESIILSKDVNYDKRYNPEKLKKQLSKNIYDDFPVLPFMNYSIRNLAKIRLEELRKKRNILIRTQTKKNREFKWW